MPRSECTGWEPAAVTRSTRRCRRRSPSLPDGVADVDLAPLLCAGIIGHRALRRAGLPHGGRLGLYGFGGSAHLCAQVALAEGTTVHVMTRGAAAWRLELGAASAQDAYARPPEPLDSAILFAPVGELVPVALRALDRGGVLAYPLSRAVEALPI
ncbi:putative alcohol dehydrogenase AdhA [Streptomyces violarus]